MNARVIAADAPGVVREAGEGHAAASAIASGGRAVILENLEPTAADTLASRMRQAGGDAERRPAANPDVTGLVLGGPDAAWRTLFDALPSEPRALADAAGALRRALDGHARDRFELRLRDRRMTVGPEPRVMGIVNVTPDSFSDGGLYLDPDRAVARGRQLAAEGADFLDVGGESTRPGSLPADEDEERRRVLPVVERLAAETAVPVSIDTRRAEVAREAVAAGATLINDVTGLQGDPAMAEVTAETGAAVVVMHMRGSPRTMQDRPTYENLMADICRHLRRGCEAATAAGVAPECLIVDPGIGFGKTLAHNLEILARLGQLRSLGRPILVGPSRKRFIGELTGVAEPAERTYGTAVSCAQAVAAGARVVRVHDVAAVRQALAVSGAILQAGERAP